MKKVLFVFWHGLGDNILATPAIKRYKEVTGNYIGWAMLKRFEKTEIFKHNPYIDQLHYTLDAWNDFSSYKRGQKAVINEAIKIAKEFGYDEVIPITHAARGVHKIIRTANEIGVELTDMHTEFYGIDKYTYQELPYKDFIFFHGKAGVEAKNLPLEYITEYYMPKYNIDLPIMSPDFSWEVSEQPIHLAASVMSKAKYIFVTDSVMYHIAHALGLRVDLAYFMRGSEVYNVVHPLHKCDEKVVYSLDK